MKNIILIILIVLASAVIFAVFRSVTSEPEGDISVADTEFENIQSVVYKEEQDTYTIFALLPLTENENLNKEIEKEALDRGEKFKKKVAKLDQEVELEDRYHLNINTQIDYASENIVAFEFETSEYLGETFAETQIGTVIFDRRTEDVYEIEDFFEAETNYLNELSEISRKELQTKSGNNNYDEQIKSGTEPKVENFEFFSILQDDEIKILFAPGQVFPISEGPQDVIISLDELGDIVNNDALKYAYPEYWEKKKDEEDQIEAGIPTKQFRKRDIDCSQIKCIALTLDDGPHNSLTPKILDDLKARDTVATFYVLGQRSGSQEEILKRMLDEGHEIGNHSWDHNQLTSVSDTEITNQIINTNNVVIKATGAKPTTMRPPYGVYNSRVQSNINMPLILWNIDPEDWKDHNADSVYNKIVGAASPGSIILVHDIHASTATAIPRVVDTLKSQGYTLVTVSELLDFSTDPDEAPKGGVYSRK